MKLKDKFIICLLVILLILTFLYSIRSILPPFIFAIFIAYILNPLVNKIESKKIFNFKISRSIITIAIILLFIIIITLFSLFVLPKLYFQFIKLINTIPNYINVIISQSYPKLVKFLEEYNISLDKNLFSFVNNQDYFNNIFNVSEHILQNLIKSSLNIFNIISLIFIVPVIVFYLIKDSSLIKKSTLSLIPAKYYHKFRLFIYKLDNILSNYLIGQLNICIFLGIFYAICLTMIAKLNFGFLIGFLTGILSFIPYIGMLIGVTFAIIIALFQWGFDLSNIFLVVIIFITGQIIEGNFLTPKLIGEKIGIHPIFIILGLFVSAILFGVIGIIFAMPMVAILSVIIKFIFREFKLKNEHER